MTLQNPWALALAAIAVPIVLMYVLKLRRQDHTVSSTLLWQRVLQDVQANAPWQRLRPNLLLLLELCALAALVFALADPVQTHAGTFSGDVVVLVDESYGMQAHDVAPSRFAFAQREARHLAADLSPGSFMSVVGMAAQPHLAIAESTEHGAIDSAINGLQVGQTAPNFLAALSLATSLVHRTGASKLIVLTSRDSGITGLPAPVSFPVQIVRIGGQLRDLGITAFSASRSGKQNRAVLSIHNFGLRRESSDVELFADGQLADVRPLSLGPGQDQNLFWTELPVSIQRLQAHLTRRDDVGGDKSAWAVLGSGPSRHVLLVSQRGYFLQTALALDPSVQLNVVGPNDYQPSLERRFDLVVFDGVVPPALPAISTLFVAPPEGRVGSLQFGGQVATREAVLATQLASPDLSSVSRYVDFRDVHIAAARSTKLPGWLQTVASSGNKPIISAGDSGRSRAAVVAFDLEKSDWPLRISYPVAMQNLLHYLVPGLALGLTNITVGQPVKLFPEGHPRELEVVKPDRSVAHLTAPFAPFADTNHPGIYVVKEVTGSTHATARFAANFFHPRTTPVSGSSVLSFGHGRRAGTRPISVVTSIAWIFGLLGVTLLSVEWWFAFRR